MNLAQFRKLCHDQWAQDRGDVRALSLTEASCEDLQRDISAEGTWPSLVRITAEECESLREGGGLPRYPNPVTRMPVTITGGAGSDTATVYCGPFAAARTVSLEAAP